MHSRYIFHHQGQIPTNKRIEVFQENELKSKLIADDFNISLLPIPRSSRQKLSREMLELSVVRNQVDLTDTLKTFHSSTNEHTFFSAAHGRFSKTEHILGHKASLNRYRKTEIVPASHLNTMDYSCTVTTKEQQGVCQLMEIEQFIIE